MISFFEIQGPNCRETLHRPLSKATLVCKKKEENTPKEPEKAQHTNQVSLISIMETVLNWVLLARCLTLPDEYKFMTRLYSSGSVRHRTGIL